MPGKNPKRFHTSKEETAHYNAVLIEGLKDEFKFVAEKVGGMEGSLKAQMASDKAELKQEIVDTRNALTMRIDNVSTELKKDIADVRMELSETRTELSQKIDRINDIVTSHDESITLLQQGASGR